MSTWSVFGVSAAAAEEPRSTAATAANRHALSRRKPRGEQAGLASGCGLPDKSPSACLRVSFVPSPRLPGLRALEGAGPSALTRPDPLGPVREPSLGNGQ